MWAKLKQRIRQHFGLTPREVNGFLVLFALLLLLLFTPTLFGWLYRPDVSTLEQDRIALDSMVAIWEQQKVTPKTEKLKKEKAFVAKSTVPQKEVRRYPFDPNTLASEGWQEMGVPRFLADRIVKYRSKGGHFRYKEDLQRIYDFPDSLYRQLVPFIQLPDKATYFSEKNTTKGTNADTAGNLANEKQEEILQKEVSDKIEIQLFDLNKADSATLRQIRGIGAILSSRIVRFRDKLGGFHSEEQLQEVYDLSPETVDELLKHATLDGANIQKLKINEASQEELEAHPYIKKNLARVLVNYRDQHGPYESVDNLRKIRILDEETLEKLTPYLSFE